MSATGMNRREFIKKTAATGLVLAGTATLAGCGLGSGGESIKWSEEADIVIIGSGFAGLAAALEATEAGAKVKIIEKMPTPGGNSIINGGDMAAAGSKMQAEMGIEDSPELMLEDMLKAGLYLNHPEKVKLVAERSVEALEWVMNYVGTKFVTVNYHGGHSVPRTHQAETGSGGDIVRPMLDKLKEKGIEVETNRKMVRLIQNEEGRVIGVEVLDKYKFGQEDSGTPVFIKAQKAVILAAGGFSQDLQMRMIHDPKLTDKLDSTNHLGATGEVLRAAMKIGAMDVQLDWIQLGPWASPDEKGFGYVPHFCERLVGYAPMINPKTGKRFINETGNRKVRADAILEIGEPVIHVADEYAARKQVIPSSFEGGLRNGSIKQFDTLEQVAEHYNIPLQPFLEEIQRWNSIVEKGQDDDFGCMIFPDAKPMTTGPFYAARLWPKVHHCMGGLVTNTQCQVINQDFEPIKGLYAAGEITGGVHGAVRLGGCAVTDCIVNGRIAGQEAAKEEAWS